MKFSLMFVHLFGVLFLSGAVEASDRTKQLSKTHEKIELQHRVRMEEVTNFPYCSLECILSECGDFGEDETTENKIELFGKIVQDFPQPEFRASHLEFVTLVRRSIDEFQAEEHDTCDGSPKRKTDPKIAKALQPLKNALGKIEKKIKK